MAKRLELTRPMVRRCAGFDAHEARWQLFEERNDIPALELAADDYVACCVDAVNLKDQLRDIETNRRDPLHVRFPRS